VLCADAAAAQTFDRMLWSASPLAFVPHCQASHPLAPRTPVVIAHAADESTPDGNDMTPSHDEVLLNLRDEWPPAFSRFQRLIEIVSQNDADRLSARARFKFYRDRGYDIRTHDLSGAQT
jgi:DNA polymerase-3 subunit chi